MTAPEPLDQRALDEALAHLRQYGAKRTTVLSIAQTLGVTHAALYRYFPSKTALFDAAVARALHPLEGELQAISQSPDPAADKLERMTQAVHRAYRRMAADDAELFEILTEAVVAGRGVGRKHRSRAQAAVQRVVEEGMASGEFVAADHKRAIAFVFDALHRFIHPVSIRLDRDVSSAALQARLDRVLAVVGHALARGRT